MKKRLLPLLLIVVLAASAFAGCSKTTDKLPSGSPSAAPGQSVAPEGQPSGEGNATGYDGKDNLKVSENPIEVTLFYPFSAGNGAPTGDMPMWQKAAEITNVTMKNVANPSITDTQLSLNTMLSSGELPDIIQSSFQYLTPIVEQGALIPMDDLIEQYAPNIKKFFEDYPDAKPACRGTDGKIYFITGTLGGGPGQVMPSEGYFMRQDWLDKLDLKTPATLEEYKEVLYAFRNDDPNGNGKKDEVPYFYRDKGPKALYQLWDVPAYEFYAGDDDKVHYGRAIPEYKDALKELSRWYQDGVIDPEIFTRGAQAREYLLGNNLGGATVDWFESTSKMNETLQEQVPGLKFVVIPPPANTKGEVKMTRVRGQFHYNGWGISKDCKDPVAVIKYMDFFMSEAGTMLEQYGVEGKSYTMENGKVKLTDEALNYTNGFANYLRSIGSGYEIGSYSNGDTFFFHPIGQEGFEMYKNSDWLVKPFPFLVFTKEEKNVIDNTMPNLRTYMDEFEQKSLMGAQDIDSAWEEYLKQLTKLGLDKVLDAYSSAYGRYLANSK